MRKYIMIMMAAALLACEGNSVKESPAAETADTQALKTEAKNVRVFELTPAKDSIIPPTIGKIELGSMKAGEVLRADFSLRNKCGKPIVILDINGSCGCVGLDTDLRPFTDGEEKKVKMSYDSAGKTGRQLALISVKTSAGEYRIEVEGNVK